MSTPPSRRKPRTDAERNRARVLEAARALFAEHGQDVQMAEVARVAEVGIGTLYRHFPTRQALIEAAAESRSAELLDHARARCLGEADPARALALFVEHVGEVLAADRGMSQVIEGVVGTTEPQGRTGEALRDVARELVERGKAVGAFRADAATSDVNMIVCGLASVIRNGAGDWRRFAEIALDGLKPGAGSPTVIQNG
ncbi:TetR/AcrR family transcriptional regulator [Nonomuraea rhodomycinica]|uniref:TetR/AcrR family transcriptional regulator n=1 Tax=Nonomuraea rhodomycinica TaxID=1712872 RepID=A0A7Y6ILN3_9ACTN|nr:TetR/AcrR family transcriptional regulator [Nonomuraea rhodomycinica]NUW40251.1 TetR/AcrR family transcriptional regulator [Nonomuraea rhodomycinica]